MSKPVDISVRMDDGVVISTEVVYPTDPATGARAAGTFPVLLTQNPYGTARSDPTARRGLLRPARLHLRRLRRARHRHLRRPGVLVRAAAGRGRRRTGELGGTLPLRLGRQGRPGRLLLPRGRPVVHRGGRRAGFRAEGDHPLLHGLQLLRRPDRRRGHPHSVRRRDRAGRAARTPGRPRHRPAVGHHRAGGRRRTALLRQRLLAVARRPAAHAADRGQRNPRPERGRLE